MKYHHGEKVFVDLDLSHGWSDKKLALNNTYVTIDKFAGYWDDKFGVFYEHLYEVQFGAELIDAYYIVEDNHLYFWPERDFGFEEAKEEEVANLLE